MVQKSAGLGQHISRAFLLSTVVVIAAQFNISLFDNNFKISVGILFLPVFLFLLDDVPLIQITIYSGLGVFLTRMLFYWNLHDTFADVVRACYPETFFYLVYGLLLFLYVRRRNPFPDRKLNPAAFFLMDYIANTIEILLRNDVPSLRLSTQAGLIGVAFVRSAMILSVITLFRRYHLVLLRQEHANRYQRLMLLISKLSGEVVWMKKNTVLIENTMNMSYRLFGELKKYEELDPSLSKTALAVAKDIHEIKKEYNLILRGISEALELNLQDDGMYLEEVLRILEAAMQDKAAEAGRHLELQCSFPPRLYTEKHYFFMSVFRNLFTNAIEASDKDVIELAFTMKADGDDYRISVTDNGPGIAPEDLEQIFQPGFSTKINYATGEVSRGLGLNLVQDLITNHFQGTISARSNPGETTFSIVIPKKELEGTL